MALFTVVLAFSSCKKTDVNLIVGRWKSTSANYFEVYYSDGTGKMWNEDDDVHENEADTFTWEISKNDNSKFTQVIKFHSGAASLPKNCNIQVLNQSSFVYNNEGWRETFNLKRIQ